MADVHVDEQSSEHQGPAPRATGIMSVLKALSFVSIIIIVEVLVGARLLPSAQETEKLAREIVAARAGASVEHADDEPDFTGRPHEDVREVEIGSYNVARFNPSTNTTLTIDVHVFGTVLAEEEAEFVERFEKSKGRVGEQVVLTLHAAETAELTDAGLGLIKRKILEKTNRALGKPLVSEVLFSKFNYVER
jgi:flagellar FliL protein